MSKDLWLNIRDELEEELGREPTGEEIDDAYADHMGDLIDCLTDHHGGEG